jgi:hypothetical protein
MSDQVRALRWAREVWRETPPSDREIQLGADRVARRFEIPRRRWTAQKAWSLAGATAAFLGTLAYAGRGTWQQPPSRVGRPAPVVHADSEQAVGASRGNARDVEHAVGASRGNAHDVEHDDSRNETRDEPTPAEIPSPMAHRAPPDQRMTRPVTEPTWVDVSNALAAHDYAHAEKLLIELTGRDHDANTRAKAHLGLAQLEEARQNCGAARNHALRAAAVPDVEIKTVRRALELATRCSR